MSSSVIVAVLQIKVDALGIESSVEVKSVCNQMNLEVTSKTHGCYIFIWGSIRGKQKRFVCTLRLPICLLLLVIFKFVNYCYYHKWL